MKSKQSVEAMQETITQLLEEEKINEEIFLSCKVNDNENYAGRHRHSRSLLFELRSQLESLEQENDDLEESKQETKVEEIAVPSPSQNDKRTNTCSCPESSEIVKVLKNIKRQNSVTHGLVSAMILVTLVWQLSEVSLFFKLFFKVKRILSNPLGGIVGGIVGSLFNGQTKLNVQEAFKQASSIKDKNIFESASITMPNFPDLLQLEMPGSEASEEE